MRVGAGSRVFDHPYILENMRFALLIRAGIWVFWTLLVRVIQIPVRADGSISIVTCNRVAFIVFDPR